MGEDNASGTLKFAIGLVITMIFIGIVIVAFTFGRSHANSAISSMSKDTSQLEEGRYTQYDGVFLSGVEVLSLIDKFELDDIFIYVQNQATTKSNVSSLPSDDIPSGFGVADADNVNKLYIYKTWSKSSGLGDRQTQEEETKGKRDARNPAKQAYITPSASYYGIVYRSEGSGAVQGIGFYRVQ
jgi:hypothetical protein